MLSIWASNREGTNSPIPGVNYWNLPPFLEWNQEEPRFPADFLKHPFVFLCLGGELLNLIISDPLKKLVFYSLFGHGSPCKHQATHEPLALLPHHRCPGNARWDPFHPLPGAVQRGMPRDDWRYFGWRTRTGWRLGCKKLRRNVGVLMLGSTRIDTNDGGDVTSIVQKSSGTKYSDHVDFRQWWAKNGHKHARSTNSSAVSGMKIYTLSIMKVYIDSFNGSI